MRKLHSCYFLYLSPCILCVLVHVVKFNSKKPHPDVTEEERSHGCSSEGHTETGFRYIGNRPIYVYGSLYTWSELLVLLVTMIKEGCENKSALLILLIYYKKIYTKM